MSCDVSPSSCGADMVTFWNSFQLLASNSTSNVVRTTPTSRSRMTSSAVSDGVTVIVTSPSELSALTGLVASLMK